MSENAVKSVETPVTTTDCVSPEWSGCKVDSESIVLSWTVGCAVHVLSQSEKHDHNVRVRLRTRESRAELTQTIETVNPEDVGDEMAKLDPGKTTETSLDRTDEDGERLPQRRTARKQRQPNAITNFTGVPRNQRELAREPMTENRKKYISKFPIQRYGASSRHTSGRRESLDRVVQFDAVQHIHQTAGTKRRAEDHPMFSSAKRAHAIHPPVHQILSQLRVECQCQESQFDVGRLCRKDQHGSMSEYCWRVPQM